MHKNPIVSINTVPEESRNRIVNLESIYKTTKPQVTIFQSRKNSNTPQNATFKKINMTMSGVDRSNFNNLLLKEKGIDSPKRASDNAELQLI